MLIEKGNRRLAVVAAGLLTLIIISIIAVFIKAHSVGVLTVTGGAVGICLSFYFHNDGKVKKAQADK